MGGKDELQKKYEELLDERIRRDEETTVRLKKEGRYKAGLDGNQEDYAETRKWFAEEVSRLQKRYKGDM